MGWQCTEKTACPISYKAEHLNAPLCATIHRAIGVLARCVEVSLRMNRTGAHQCVLCALRYPTIPGALPHCIGVNGLLGGFYLGFPPFLCISLFVYFFFLFSLFYISVKTSEEAIERLSPGTRSGPGYLDGTFCNPTLPLFCVFVFLFKPLYL